MATKGHAAPRPSSPNQLVNPCPKVPESNQARGNEQANTRALARKNNRRWMPSRRCTLVAAIHLTSTPSSPNLLPRAAMVNTVSANSNRPYAAAPSC